MSMIWSDDFRRNWFPVRWVFTDDRDILIAVECHGECPRDRCRRHHEDMWEGRDLIHRLGRVTQARLEDSFTDIFCELFSLFDAKSVLFIDDDIREMTEMRILRYECMRSYDDRELS